MKISKKFTKYFFIILAFHLCNCKDKSDTEQNLNGYYGRAEYFQTKNTNSEYIEDLILEIDNDKIKIFGTVQTWGRICNYKLNITKDTILLGENTKIYCKNNSCNILYFETKIENKIEKTEYIKIPDIGNAIDKEGINSQKFGNLLDNLLIVGKYKYENKIINFNKDGKVENLSEFSKYMIRPRLGTFTYYDNRIIETENGIWKYQKKNNNLILTKYTTRRDDLDRYVLGNQKIELVKITSH